MMDRLIARLVEPSRTSRGWLARCPFHPDGGRRNLYVYEDTESFYCYRCGAAGSLGRLLAALGEPTAGSAGGGRLRRRRDEPQSAGAVLTLAARVYARDLDHPAAREYLRARGIPLPLAEAFGLGYARGDRLRAALAAAAGAEGASADAGVRAGLLRPDGSEVLRGRLIIPEWRGRQVVFLTGRAVGPAEPRYLSAAVPRRVFFLERARRRGRPVVVVEGPFDALAFWAAGIPAVALGGSPGRRLLGELETLGPAVLIPDADPAGAELARELPARLPGLQVRSLPAGAGDPAELARRSGPEALRALLTGPQEKPEEGGDMYARISFIGNLGADPEFSYTAEGRAVLRFRTALNMRRRGGNEETFWVAVTVFGPQADRLNQRLQKGTRVLVDGRLALHRFTRRDGSGDVGLDVAADRVLILDRAAAAGAEGAEEVEDDLPF